MLIFVSNAHAWSDIAYLLALDLSDSLLDARPREPWL